MKREFTIPFVGLKNGIHNFEYEVDRLFFEDFENALINDCNVTIDLQFEKSSRLFVLEFKIDGEVEVECDRCSEPYLQDIFGDYTVFVKFDDGSKDNEDDVIYISREDTHLDIRKLIYDYINLSLPMKRTHKNDKDGNPTCNPAILKILKNSGAENKGEETDPRWDALKQIKTKK